MTDRAAWCLGDRAAWSLGGWLALTLALILVCYRFNVGFPEKRFGDLLATRLALLGLVGAIATFQYGTWLALALRTQDTVHNPEWETFEANLERDRMRAQSERDRTAEQAPALPERQAAPLAWHTWRIEALSRVLNYALRNTRAVLIGYVAAAYALMLSTTADAAALLWTTDERWTGAIATGSFVAVFPRSYPRGAATLARSVSSSTLGRHSSRTLCADHRSGGPRPDT